MEDLTYKSFKKEALEDPETKKAYEEIQKLCATCRKGDNNADERCPDRGACFTPNYDSWEPIGSETEDTGCETCSHWKAVKIGKFCPDCAQALR